MGHLKFVKLTTYVCAEKFHIQWGFIHRILDSHSWTHVDVFQLTTQAMEFFSEAQHFPVIIGKYPCVQFLTSQMDMNTGDLYIFTVMIPYELNRLLFINAKFWRLPAIPAKRKVGVNPDADVGSNASLWGNHLNPLDFIKTISYQNRPADGAFNILHSFARSRVVDFILR